MYINYAIMSIKLCNSAKCRHQSAEWTILSNVNALFRERLLDFRSCWIVFIHLVWLWGHPAGLLQFSKGKLLRSWHLFCLAFGHCGQTGRQYLDNSQKVWLPSCPSHLIIPHYGVIPITGYWQPLISGKYNGNFKKVLKEPCQLQHVNS